MNGTPTPPLPSVTYRTLDELSGNQTFKTAGVSLPATTGNGGAAKTYKFGSGIALAYDAAADSYTLTSPEGYSVTMTQAELDPSSSQDSSTYFKRADPTEDRVLLARRQVNGVRLNYTMFGSWTHIADTSDPGGTQRTDLAFGGVPTQASDVPKSGTANYDTFVGGTIISNNRPYMLNDQASSASYSSATFSINFETGAVDTALNLKGSPPGGGAFTDFGKFTGSGTLDSGGPGFSGALAGADTSGAFAGALFGPQGKEMGYAWYLLGSTFEGRGIVVGAKK
ncbi:hypothetical protein FHS51_003649 [Sphingobium wenxiniae]|uniref:Transferrin-binding protein B C-lobe/N-lobe beta barrel domain-containing protein n=2 Tax=Sphingobium TaxID=165695 RepID=T0G7Z8_9SPHN|nr:MULTISPECIES: hypothetical protein [Sphingobium]EQA96751.1 hypothetical protein L485_21965 [Sphingobium baderi LL03]KMS64032.1 hypothetical protein V475_23560 [Sphingobium baderi LL03]MBB6193393.1 hypothetical protein [Sphingobium wenxiniae]TWH90087.1 hypothetical protein IQ35_03734 [Sphingobium wenxiniae]